VQNQVYQEIQEQQALLDLLIQLDPPGKQGSPEPPDLLGQLDLLDGLDEQDQLVLLDQ
jgi:hypothetical protein